MSRILRKVLMDQAAESWREKKRLKEPYSILQSIITNFGTMLPLGVTLSAMSARHGGTHKDTATPGGDKI
jgi:hypothetical protein